jgi:hypothetical protein
LQLLWLGKWRRQAAPDRPEEQAQALNSAELGETDVDPWDAEVLEGEESILAKMKGRSETLSCQGWSVGKNIRPSDEPEVATLLFPLPSNFHVPLSSRTGGFEKSQARSTYFMRLTFSP